jgi:aryl-alcohol dehydrogenase-like predicted oxidoreductase
LEVAPLALGGNVFDWTADEATSFKILDKFVDSGFNLIDTANVYSRWIPGHSGGESEKVIGKWQKSGKRGKVIIATKVGVDMGEGNKGLSKAYILRAVEESLQRLQTDHIDLYQSHIDDKETPVEETLEAYEQLIKQGKVLAIGASNFSAERLTESLEVSRERGIPSYQCLQPNYNLYDREEYEAKLEPVCLKAGIGVIPYFSLARGFLSGKYRSEGDLMQSPRGAGIKKYLDGRGFRILACLDKLAKELNTKPASIAIAWLIARPSITAPISSATNLDQLDELISAGNLKLDKSQIEELNTASTYA